MPSRVRPTPTILVVEADADIRAITAEVLRDAGYRAVAAPTRAAAHTALRAVRFALVLSGTLGRGRPPHEHWRALEALRDAAGATPVVIFTAHTPARFADHAARGFAGLVPKPFDVDELLAVVRAALGDAVPRVEALEPCARA